MNISLYKAADELRAILDRVDPETGELPPDYQRALEVVRAKSAAVGAYILQTDSECDLVEARGKELIARAKVQRQRNQKLRAYLRDHMIAAGIKEIQIEDGARIRAYAQRDPAIEIFDARLIGEELLEDPKPREPSKSKIRAAIEAGKDVQGARLVWRDRLEIKG